MNLIFLLSHFSKFFRILIFNLYLLHGAIMLCLLFHFLLKFGLDELGLTLTIRQLLIPKFEVLFKHQVLQLHLMNLFKMLSIRLPEFGCKHFDRPLVAFLQFFEIRCKCIGSRIQFIKLLLWYDGFVKNAGLSSRKVQYIDIDFTPGCSEPAQSLCNIVRF